jgi:hypothetical protein
VSKPAESVDARTDRAAQATVGVVLLAGFVFRVTWVVPVLILVLGVGALAGPEGNVLHRVFERWIAPRLPAPSAPLAEDAVPEVTVRAQDALAAVVLAVAGLAFLLGISPVGWVLVIAEGVIAILAATTRLHAGDWLRRRL